MRKKHGLILYSLISAILLGGAVVLLVSQWQAQKQLKAEQSGLNIRHQLLKRNLWEIQQFQHYLKASEAVLSKARKLGLTQQGWQKYTVNRQSHVQWEELRNVLEQTHHGKNYFFHGEMLTISRDDPVTTSTRASTNRQKDDLYLELKGHFWVKRESL